MKDYEFRCLEEFLKNSGVECRRFMDKSKVDAFRKNGAELLFYSFFGENLFTGEAGTLVLARNPDGSPASSDLLYAARKFGEELVKREKTRLQNGDV
jgi:hypothetical protein